MFYVALCIKQVLSNNDNFFFVGLVTKQAVVAFMVGKSIHIQQEPDTGMNNDDRWTLAVTKLRLILLISKLNLYSVSLIAT